MTSDAEHNLGEAAGLPESHRGESARIEAFSDAIFGFAATLLVVSLEVPRDFAAMAASLRGFVAFGLSFATLAAIWTVHRGFFRRFPIGDGTTVVLNTVLMFLILFYVYPLKFLARTIVVRFFGAAFLTDAAPITVDELGRMFAIYGIGWAAVFACVAMMYFHASRRGHVMAIRDRDERTASDYAGHYVTFAIVGLVSTAVAMAGIGVKVGLPGFIYGLMGPALGVYWTWRRRVRERSVA